jgi:hypothetical protein
MTAERWACARCGTKNVGSVASCASCGLLRGSVAVPSPLAGSIPGGTRSTGMSAADLPDTPADPRVFPVAFGLGGPFLVIGYTRARLRERGGRAARRAVLAMAVGSPLVVMMLAWAAASGQEALFLPIGILGPLLLGVVAGIAIPGVAGWTFAVIGSALGGLAVGVGLWLGVGIGGVDVGPNGPVGPLEALVYVALMAMLVPILMGAQIGVGVFIGSGLAAIRGRHG